MKERQDSGCTIEMNEFNWFKIFYLYIDLGVEYLLTKGTPIQVMRVNVHQVLL